SNTKAPQNCQIRKRIKRPSNIKFYNAGIGGTDCEDHKLALYRTSVNSRKWPIRIIFHFLLAAVLNAHILYKLKNLIQATDYLYHVGDWVEEAATQMKAKGSAATRTFRTQAAA
ncbi:MAG: hypothetical protein ACK559_04360, partial [bacterium]